jgi:spermidine synthase
VLVLGVGGGALPMALRRIMPAARIDAVDHDEAVLQVAQAFFGLTAGDGLQLHASDARAFVQRSSSEAARRYDAIVLDVFDDDYIPAPLMTMEFLHEMRRILAPRGVLAANTFGPEPLMRREYATYAAVYGDLRVVTVGWNRLLVVGEAAASVARNLERGELHGAQALSTLGFESSRLARCVEHVSVCPSDAPICDAEVGSHALQAWRKRAVARPASIGWSGMAAALLDARVRAHTRSAGDGLA